KALGIRSKTYYLNSTYPKNYCIAQSPKQGEIVQDQPMILYISSGNAMPVLMPDLRNKPLQEVTSFLEQSHIKPEITHQAIVAHDHACTDCTITNQRPLPGSIVTLNNDLKIQLMVR